VVATTHETILAAADLADQRRSTWRHTVPRIRRLVAVRALSPAALSYPVLVTTTSSAG
jgi:hypothetical protein